MIKNVNFLVTDQCNSKCRNCNIWRNKVSRDISIEKIEKLFSLQEFSSIQELAISGGEPYYRSDFLDVIRTIFQVNKSFDTIYITTNATYPKKVLESLDIMQNQENIKHINIGISIDGIQSTNKQIRGIDNYSLAIELLHEMQKYKKINRSISMTITEMNCDLENLEHIKQIANKYNCDYTFRLATYNESYYKNIESKSYITSDMRSKLVQFIIDNKLNDPFMREQLYYLLTGKIPIMYDYNNNQLICRAGEKFVFIHSDGQIYPCINSTVPIGDYSRGIVSPIVKCSDNCPCMTECSIWPMILK